MNVAACADVKGLAAGVATAAAFSSGVVGCAAPPRRLSRSSRAPVPASPWKMSGDVPVALGKPVARSFARCRAFAASAAAAPRSDITLNEVLAQLAVKQLGARAPVASETVLPPFQSDVESRVEAAAEGDAEVSFAPAAPPRLATRAGDAVRGIPPLPLPPKTSAASQLAVVAVAPDAAAAPTPEHLGVPSTPGGQAAAAALTLGAPAAAAAVGAVGVAAHGAPSVAPVFAAPPAVYFAVTAVACVFGGALSAFLLAFIPTLRAVQGAADEIANLAASIREEVPDTLAAVRVSGMELTDCLEEVGELTADVGAGVKGTGRAVAATVDTAGAVGRAAGETVKRVLPEVKARATPVVKRVLERSEKSIEDTLRTNAEAEEYSEPVVAAAARATKNGVKYARGAIRAAGVARTVGRAYKAVKGVNSAGAAEVANEDDKKDA